MDATREWLADFQKELRPQILDVNKPSTALLARFVHKKVSKLHRVLEKEFETIELHQRLFKSMLESNSLKQLRNCYVANLHFYIERVGLRNTPNKQKASDTERLIAGVMSAAGLFSAAERAKGVEHAVHMTVWRAKKFIQSEFYDNDESPVFQWRPKTTRA